MLTLPKPTQPLTAKPAGYLSLASYSSLGTFWSYLAGAEAQGRQLSVLRGDSEATCRRRIAGYSVAGAGFLLDDTKLLAALEDGLDPHPALLALLVGDPLPVRELLSTHYQLQAHFVLAFDRHRDLLLRPEFKFVPLAATPPQENLLPRDLPLLARRLGRDELHVLLKRACGLGL